MARAVVIGEQERAIILQTIVGRTAHMPLREALEKFGEGLSEVEKQMLASLTDDELSALRSVSLKLPGVGLRRLGFFDDNNNNNPCPQT
jgi:hypothetical protein